MYIIAIAWIYVVLLMSFTEASIVAGLATFFLYGLGPLALVLYLLGTPQRRRNRRRREALMGESGRVMEESDGPQNRAAGEPVNGAAEQQGDGQAPGKSDPPKPEPERQ